MKVFGKQRLAQYESDIRSCKSMQRTPLDFSQKHAGMTLNQISVMGHFQLGQCQVKIGLERQSGELGELLAIVQRDNVT